MVNDLKKGKNIIFINLPFSSDTACIFVSGRSKNTLKKHRKKNRTPIEDVRRAEQRIWKRKASESVELFSVF